MKCLGENLIFLISLPRSGSTLLQHILAGHSAVVSTTEPWILLPCVYALRPGALQADYNAHVGQIGLSEFLAQLDDGEEQYFSAVRKMAIDLYNAYLAKHNKKRFLDKTARYYLILPEMFRIFPEAQYVFLLRNPLAVLWSFLESMVCGNWIRLGNPGIRNDLLDGYRLIYDGIRYFGDNAVVVTYEDLVTDPEASVRRLCTALGLNFEPDVLNYGKRELLPGTLLDQKSIHKHQTPVDEYMDVWKSKFTMEQEKHFAHAFLTHLGPELINSLGYSYEELVSAVPKEQTRLAPLMQWDLLMIPPDQRTHLEMWKLQIAWVWQKQGPKAALKYVGRHFKALAIRLLSGG